MSASPSTAAVSLGLAVPLVLGYASGLLWVWREWEAEGSYYTHGPILPLLAAWLVWSRREALAGRPRVLDARGWLLLAPGLLLHVAGAALMVDSLSAFSLCLSVPGAVWLSQGWPRFRLLAPITGLTLFAVPPPSMIVDKFVFVLKEVAVSLGTGLANLVGAGVTRVGASLQVPGDATPLVVADACGGLRSLVSLTTVGYVVAFFFGSGRGIVPWLVLACAMPVAILSNVLRIASMCVMSRAFGVEFGAGLGHDIANVVVWVGAIVALLALDALFSKWFGSNEREAAAA